MDSRQARLATLRSAQNSDGGWGYQAGRQSWLEPTCYALLALAGDAASRDAVQRGWTLIRSWQNADGSWRPSGQVQSSSWATALCLTLHCARRAFDGGFDRGMRWMLETRGSEGSWTERIYNFIRPLPGEYDRRYRGWPWRPDTVSWVEPTAHALVALKSAAAHLDHPLVRKALERGPGWSRRVDDGERMLIDRRTSDGGWNHGSRRVLKTDLPSYPESTGLALMGLQGCPHFDARPALDLAERYWKESTSPLAKAWLAIALRNHGREVAPQTTSPPGGDLMVVALEAISYPNGGHQWLKVGAQKATAA
ncbi:MAG: prenyltransferase/squalene oxidase repeat-containing protein [Bryobacteraceae bacterium]|nr:prenyltransferase/squalene oxidase repeat-containing protein [Bryobacteraceae bacterium]